MSRRKTLKKHIFRCKDCGGNYFISRKECCPFVYKNIIDRVDRIDNIVEFEKRIAEKNFRKDPVRFGKQKIYVPSKYLPRPNDPPGKEQPKNTTIKQYRKILKNLDFKNKVVIDYGCSLAHASKTIKDYCKHNTYIPDYSSDRCLGNIRENSIDLVIASRVTQWKEAEGWIANFLDEVTRVLKPNGYLYFHSNSDKFGGGKRYLFNYLLKNFTCGPGKQKPALSKSIWGNGKAYLKSDKDMNRKKELLKPVRGLFRLKK
jgi:SAM-dependent methyltransferase